MLFIVHSKLSLYLPQCSLFSQRLCCRWCHYFVEGKLWPCLCRAAWDWEVILTLLITAIKHSNNGLKLFSWWGVQVSFVVSLKTADHFKEHCISDENWWKYWLNCVFQDKFWFENCRLINWWAIGSQISGSWYLCHLWFEVLFWSHDNILVLDKLSLKDWVCQNTWACDWLMFTDGEGELNRA